MTAGELDVKEFPKGHRLRLALILGALAGLGPFSIDMYLPALPRLAGDLHTSASLAQLSLTSFLLGLALGQIVAGPFSDVRGRRLPLLGGALVYAAASLFCALSPNIWMLITMRLLQGLAGSVGMVVGRAIVRDLFSGTQLTKFVAGLMLVSGAAPVIAPIAGGQLLKFASWHGVFVVLSVLGAIIFLAVLLGIPETLDPECRMGGGLKDTFSAFGGLLKDRVFVGYALAQGLVSAALFAYISGSPFVLQNIFRVSPQMFSMLFAINSCGIILAGQLTGRLAGRVTETRLFVTGLGICLTGGVGLLMAVLTGGGLISVLIPFFLVVSSQGIVATAGFTLAMQNQGKAAGTASGLLGVASFILGSLSAPLVGMGGAANALPLAIVIASAASGAMLCYLSLVRQKR